MKKKENLRWLTDSQTGESVLVDINTCREVGRWRKEGTCPTCGQATKAEFKNRSSDWLESL